MKDKEGLEKYYKEINNIVNFYYDTSDLKKTVDEKIDNLLNPLEKDGNFYEVDKLFQSFKVYLGCGWNPKTGSQSGFENARGELLQEYVKIAENIMNYLYDEGDSLMDELENTIEETVNHNIYVPIYKLTMEIVDKYELNAEEFPVEDFLYSNYCMADSFEVKFFRIPKIRVEEREKYGDIEIKWTREYFDEYKKIMNNALMNMVEDARGQIIFAYVKKVQESIRTYSRSVTENIRRYISSEQNIEKSTLNLDEIFNSFEEIVVQRVEGVISTDEFDNKKERLKKQIERGI